MKKRAYIAGGLVLLGGLALGVAWKVFDQGAAAPTTPPRLAPVVHPSSNLPGPSQTVAVASVAAPNPTVLPSGESYWSLSAFKQRHGDPVRITLVDRQGNLSDRVVQTFALSPAERDGLETVLADALRKIEDLAVASSKVEVESPSRLTIHIPPFEGGGAIYDQTVEALTPLLGSERAALFQSVMYGELAKTLGGFGVQRRDITVGRVVAYGNPEFVILRQTTVTASPDIPASQSLIGGPQSFAEKPSRLSPLNLLYRFRDEVFALEPENPFPAKSGGR